MRRCGRTTSFARWLAVLGLVVLASGCADGPARHADEVAAAGERAQQRQQDVLTRLAFEGTLVQHARADSCAGGQDNWVVRDDFEFSCVFSTAAVYGLDGGDVRATAGQVESALDLAAGADRGCSPIGRLADSEGVPALELQRPGARAAFSIDCPGPDVEVILVRSDDVAVDEVLAGRPHGPQGTILRQEELDPAAAAAAAGSAGAELLLLVELTETYFEQPR